MTEAATSPKGATEEEPADQRGKAGRSVKRDYEAGNGNHLPPVFGGTAPLITAATQSHLFRLVFGDSREKARGFNPERLAIGVVEPFQAVRVVFGRQDCGYGGVAAERAP